MSLLNIGVTGLLANQSGIVTTGNNIANANVEGYSRQEVLFESLPSQFSGNGFLGKGVGIETIRRITDQFVTQQLRLDTASFNQLDAFAGQIQQLDSLLAGETTGLSAAFDSYFTALQAAADSPTSLPARQLVLTEAELLAQRFNVLQARLVDQSQTINDQVRTFAPEVSLLAASIAESNQRIIEAKSVSPNDKPNELLDQREELLRQLSELVSYTTSVQDGDVINVFIGGGQPLVLGSQANEVIAVENEFDPSRVELAINVNNRPQVVTSSFSGGQLGGLLEFRDEVLDSVIGSIGLLALSFTSVTNEQHRAGIDLAGDAGLNLFTPINTEAAQLQRMISASGNGEPNDRVTSATITDIAALTGDDYEFRLSGNGPFNYTLLRVSDGSIVESGLAGNVFPQTITTTRGFTINLESGTFQDGDAFLVRPTRFSAANIEVTLNDPVTLALGAPVVAEASLVNTGNGEISQGSIINVGDIDLESLPAFATARELTPPLLVRFTSPTTYDVLDNSDPVNPVQLNPPLRNQQYIPNQSNSLLPFDLGATFVTSDGAVTTTAPSGAIGTVNNGYPGETFGVNFLDPETGELSNSSVNILANESAATAAARINTLEGVTATANTSMTFSVVDAATGAPPRIRFNGVDITDPALGISPAPLTSDFLAGRINQLFAGTGITAIDTGTEVQVQSIYGDDFRLEQIGVDPADQIQVTEVNGAATLATAAAGNEIVVGGTVDVVIDSNYTVTSSGGIFSNPTPLPMPAYLGYQVEISGAPNTGDEFLISFNSTGVGDNRNALALVGMQTADILRGGSQSLLDNYGQLVSKIGAETSSATVDLEAAESLLSQTLARRDSIAGVNLDEEAAKLIEFEQAYNASAQVIAIARALFDSLLGVFR